MRTPKSDRGKISHFSITSILLPARFKENRVCGTWLDSDEPEMQVCAVIFIHERQRERERDLFGSNGLWPLRHQTFRSSSQGRISLQILLLPSFPLPLKWKMVLGRYRIWIDLPHTQRGGTINNKVAGNALEVFCMGTIAWVKPIWYRFCNWPIYS